MICPMGGIQTHTLSDFIEPPPILNCSEGQVTSWVIRTDFQNLTLSLALLLHQKEVELESALDLPLHLPTLFITHPTGHRFYFRD